MEARLEENPLSPAYRRSVEVQLSSAVNHIDIVQLQFSLNLDLILDSFSQDIRL